MINKNRSLLENLLNDSSFENWAKSRNQNDVAFWKNWILENPEKIDIVYDARAILLGVTFTENTLPEKKINFELQKIVQQIASNKKSRVFKTIPSRRVQKYLAAAAVSILFMVFGYTVLDRPTEIIHKTGYGEIMNLKLPDGTTVVLNGNSRISYKKKNPREVTLIGQAYFKVKSIQETRAKFWVNTDDLRVEVYGTQFHVNTRDEKTEVILDEGSIHLLLENGISKKMVPGELVSFSKKKDKVMHEKVDNELTYAVWREDTYVFNNTSLKTVMKYIEHSYGLPVEFANSGLEKITLSGGIPNSDLKICLSAIEKSTGTKITKMKNKLLITNN